MGKMSRAPVIRQWPIAHSLLPIACSCLALALFFWGGLQIDLPLARFLRSVHLPWLELAGDVGSRLGSGAFLAGISGALLAIGLIFKQPRFRQAGLESLIAHAAVALTTQVLKHLVGRPRPRMTHGGGFQLGPSWDLGMDSFPSGHAAASFAVAHVLARRFPRAGWVLYGTAALVALSRVVRGSHFPTDVFAGVGLGLVAGYVVANPIRAWRSSLVEALNDAAPYLVGAFALLWIGVHAAPDWLLNAILFSVGAAGVGIGVGIRWRILVRSSKFKGQNSTSNLEPRTARYPIKHSTLNCGVNSLVVLGLAAAATSWLVMTVTVLLVIARWLEARGSRQFPGKPPPMTTLAEVTLAVGLVVALVAIQSVKGVLPLL